jgi:hypothetical protein
VSSVHLLYYLHYTRIRYESVPSESYLGVVILKLDVLHSTHHSFCPCNRSLIVMKHRGHSLSRTLSDIAHETPKPRSFAGSLRQSRIVCFTDRHRCCRLATRCPADEAVAYKGNDPCTYPAVFSIRSPIRVTVYCQGRVSLSLRKSLVPCSPHVTRDKFNSLPVRTRVLRALGKNAHGDSDIKPCACRQVQLGSNCGPEQRASRLRRFRF